MNTNKQLSFADYQISQSRKVTRSEEQLRKIEKFVNWDKIVGMFSVIDRTGELGGRPRKELIMMSKILFIQYLYNFSDPELEDQLNDRLSFQRFAGIGMDEGIAVYSTIWRFKESLIKENLYNKLFDMIIMELEDRGLILKKGTIVDATIVPSHNKPLSRKKREELQISPSNQIDTEASSTKKNGKYYFGYKGHIGVDVGSKLIRKKGFTTASVHDINEKDKLISGDERAHYGDKAYNRDEDKREARKKGIFYGILDKARRGQKLSSKQQKRNKNLSKVRASVEHPFACMKRILHYEIAYATTKVRNDFRFTMNCIVYNILRANYLTTRAA